MTGSFHSSTWPSSSLLILFWSLSYQIQSVYASDSSYLQCLNCIFPYLPGFVCAERRSTVTLMVSTFGNELVVSPHCFSCCFFALYFYILTVYVTGRIFSGHVYLGVLNASCLKFYFSLQLWEICYNCIGSILYAVSVHLRSLSYAVGLKVWSLDFIS